MVTSTSKSSGRRATFWAQINTLPSLLFITLLLFATSTASAPTEKMNESPGSIPQEINPVTPKFKTIPDPSMPGYPDFGISVKDGLATWDDEHMALSTTKFLPGMFQTRLGVGNGYAGATVAAAGPFFERDVNQTNHNGSQPSEGWPMRNPRQTFGTISGFFDCQATTPETNFEELRSRGCESIISGIPHSLGFHLVAGNQVLNSTVDEKTVSNFTQTMSYQDGVVQWKYTWAPRNMSVRFDVEMTSFMHRTRPNVAASELRVTPRGGNCNVSIVDLIDGRSAVRSSLGEKGMSDSSDTFIYVSNHPEGLPTVTAWTLSKSNVSNGYTVESSRRATAIETSSDMSIGQEWDVALVDEETAVFQKFIGLATSDKFVDPRSTAIFESHEAFVVGWDAIIEEHRHAWNNLMSPDRVLSLRDPVSGILPVNDEHVQQLQIMHTASHFYLLQNLLDSSTNLNDNSVSVGGLTSDSYGGLVFWDADFWMFPTIMETNPDYAAQFPNYRVKTYAQSKANAQEDYVQAKYNFDKESALYSWTSGRYGNATGTGPVLDYEEHINAIVAISMFEWLAVTGNEGIFKEKYWPVVRSIGHTIATLLQKDGTGYSIRNMTDPDEYANHVDDGAFTLAAFSQVLGQINSYQLEHGLEVNQTWVDMQYNINIPHDASSGITKEYRTMQNNITVKQADVTMLSYPLMLANYSLSDSIRDLHYYSQKQTNDGPAMTAAIAAIAENRVSGSGCAAFTLDMQASLPNLRAPWYQFSEQADDDANSNGGTSPAFPFLTGHGGALQIPLYGYLGLARAKNGLTIRPSLPPPYKHMQLPEFYRAGNRFKASMNSTHTNITRLPNTHHTELVDVYPGGKMPIVIEHRVMGPGSKFQIEEEKFEISLNETLTLKNDMYWNISSTPGNVLQCKTARADSTGGQYVGGPGAAVDGSDVTYWQPSSLGKSRLTVAVGSAMGRKVKQVRVQWGARVPEMARVVFSNSTSTSSSDVEVNLSPIANMLCDGSMIRVVDETKIQLHQKSCTSQDIGAERGIWTAKYATLEIEGCQNCGDDGVVEERLGATVGEFEVIV